MCMLLADKYCVQKIITKQPTNHSNNKASLHAHDSLAPIVVKSLQCFITVIAHGSEVRAACRCVSRHHTASTRTRAHLHPKLHPHHTHTPSRDVVLLSPLSHSDDSLLAEVCEEERFSSLGTTPLGTTPGTLATPILTLATPTVTVATPVGTVATPMVTLVSPWQLLAAPSVTVS